MLERMLDLCPSLQSFAMTTCLYGILSADSRSCVWTENTLSTIVRGISSIPITVRRIVMQLRITRVVPMLQHSPQEPEVAQNLVDEALIGRFKKRLPMVRIQPEERRMFRDKDIEELKLLFPKIIAAERLEIAVFGCVAMGVVLTHLEPCASSYLSRSLCVST